MSVSLFALALFGCSDDGTVCERLSAPVETYEDRAQCTSSLETALASETARKADAPTVFAQCLDRKELAALGTGTIDLTKVGPAQFAGF